MTPNGYDTDVVIWSEHQAELLRQLARGKPANEAPDWDNIIEEVLDVGLSAIRACRSHLRVAITHQIKILAWPNSRNVPHWTTEARAALFDAADDYLPSMRARMDLERIYQRALMDVPETVDGELPLAIPKICPFTLDELLDKGRF